VRPGRRRDLDSAFNMLLAAYPRKIIVIRVRDQKPVGWRPG
jgi:hypothetical protein